MTITLIVELLSWRKRGRYSIEWPDLALLFPTLSLFTPSLYFLSLILLSLSLLPIYLLPFLHFLYPASPYTLLLSCQKSTVLSISILIKIICIQMHQVTLNACRPLCPIPFPFKIHKELHCTPGCFLDIKECSSYFSMMVIKYYDQKQLVEEFIITCSCKGIESKERCVYGMAARAETG